MSENTDFVCIFIGLWSKYYIFEVKKNWPNVRNTEIEMLQKQNLNGTENNYFYVYIG